MCGVDEETEEECRDGERDEECDDLDLGFAEI